MNRKYLLIKSVEIYVEQITDHWYSICPPRPVEKQKKLCVSETVEYAFKKVEQIRLFKGANLRVGVAPPQILSSIEKCRNLTCIIDSFNRQGFRG